MNPTALVLSPLLGKGKTAYSMENLSLFGGDFDDLSNTQDISATIVKRQEFFTTKNTKGRINGLYFTFLQKKSH